ncbi:HD domain-containing protein [bacterium]|nr:HD domain-containing protein [bacterium]
MKLLLYHDIVEIKTGDIPELDWEGRQDKEKNERKAFEQFKDQLPKELYDEYSECFEEFEAAETLEAKFAQAIDKLEPMIHQLDHKCDWRKYGYTQEVLWDKKGKYMEPFPALMNFYQKFIKHLMNNDYID